MNYREALSWLYGTQLHGIKLGLEAMHRLLAVLEVPLTGAEAPRFIHVAGTNGKGSTCAMLESILRAAGWRTGLYTSPHLVDFRERIRVDEEMIGHAAVVRWITRLRELTAEWEHTPTFFELTTAMALAHFAEQKVEVAVLETGMGGRLDATNVVTPLVSVIAPIGLDHQQYLGEGLAQIAIEKGGIIKPGVPVVCARQEEVVLMALGHLALERNATFHLVVTPLAEVPVALAGSHQRWNAALAVHALDVSGLELTPSAVAQGLQEVAWPARFQRLTPRMVVDGAHNPAAAAVLARTWREEFGEERCTLVMGAMGDKDVAGICQALAPLAARVLAVPVRNPRSLSAGELVQVWREVQPAGDYQITGGLEEALERAENWTERVLVAGSLFLAGEVLAYAEGQEPGG